MQTYCPCIAYTRTRPEECPGVARFHQRDRFVRVLRDERSDRPGAANTRLKALKALFVLGLRGEAGIGPAKSNVRSAQDQVRDERPPFMEPRRNHSHESFPGRGSTGMHVAEREQRAAKNPRAGQQSAAAAANTASS